MLSRIAWKQWGWSLGLMAVALGGAAEPVQPNILWIITDDHRPDALQVYNRAVRGQSDSPLGYVSSPAADALAAQGTLFTRAYCNAPACAPSRSSMYTGTYPHRLGIYGFERAHNQSDVSRPLISSRLSELGYRTAMFGKNGSYIFEWGPGLTWRSPKIYDHRVDMKADLQAKGKTDHYNHAVWEPIDGQHQNPGTYETFHFPDGSTEKIWSPRPKFADQRPFDAQGQQRIDERLDILRAHTRTLSKMIFGGRSPQPLEGTLDGHIVGAMKAHLAAPTDDDRPLYVQLGFHFPHTPVLPPQSFRDAFAGQVYDVPDFDEASLQALPTQLRVLFGHMQMVGLSDDEKQQMIRDYYAFCAAGDALVGEAVESFKAYSQKQGRPYFIVYTVGDHGWHLGEQGIAAKFGPYQASLGGAAIVVSSQEGDRFPAGTAVDDYIEYVDFLPTMLAAAAPQAELDPKLDGFDLADVADGTVSRDYVLGEMSHVYGPRAWLRSDDYAFSMRTRPPDMKGPGDRIDWALTADVIEVEPALFDLRADPGETTNVAADPRYAAVVAALRDKLGRIVLGDGRVEANWKQKNDHVVSDFAAGAHDHRLEPLGLDAD